MAERSFQPGGLHLRRARSGAVAHGTGDAGRQSIFFAGEALSILKHGSLPGAYDSGQTAARLVLEAL